MKRKIAIVLFLSSFICSCCGGQTIRFDRVKSHVHLPLIIPPLITYGHSQLDAFLFEEDGKGIYLDDVGKFDRGTLSLLSGEANPIVYFNFREETELTRATGHFQGEFILEEDGRYRIMGYTSLGEPVLKKPRWDDSILREPNTGDPMAFEPEPYLIGYSDDTTLLVMRVLKYLNEHYTEPAVYSEADVDRRPSFLVSMYNKQITSDTKIEKEIRKWLLDPPEHYLEKESLKGVRGKIELSYLIGTDGAACHIKIEQAKINRPEKLPYIYREIVQHAIMSLRWQPASLNGENVVVKRNFTIKI